MTTTMSAADTDALDGQVGQMGAKADSRTTERSITTARSPATGAASRYGYDQAAELTNAATPPTGGGPYTYNGAGLRTSKTVGGVQA